MSDGSKSFEEKKKSLYFLSGATFIGRWRGGADTLQLVMLFHCFHFQSNICPNVLRFAHPLLDSVYKINEIILNLRDAGFSSNVFGENLPNTDEILNRRPMFAVLV